MSVKTLDVKGMSCGHCKASVEEALQSLNGVERVEVNLESGKVNVTYNEAKVSLRQMEEAIEEQGYDVE